MSKLKGYISSDSLIFTPPYALVSRTNNDCTSRYRVTLWCPQLLGTCLVPWNSKQFIHIPCPENTCVCACVTDINTFFSVSSSMQMQLLQSKENHEFLTTENLRLSYCMAAWQKHCFLLDTSEGLCTNNIDFYHWATKHEFRCLDMLSALHSISPTADCCVSFISASGF